MKRTNEIKAGKANKTTQVHCVEKTCEVSNANKTCEMCSRISSDNFAKCWCPFVGAVIHPNMSASACNFFLSK